MTFDGNSYQKILEHHVKDSIKVVKCILAANRNPEIASSVTHDHNYDDKFLLSQIMTNVGLTSFCNAIDALDDYKGSLQKAVFSASKQNKSITLKFKAKERCAFLSEEDKEEGSIVSTEETKEVEDEHGVKSKVSTKRKMFNKVKLFHWEVIIEYEVYLLVGNESNSDGEDRHMLLNNERITKITHKGRKISPVRQRVFDYDMNLSWLMNIMDKQDSSVKFFIDRSLDSCCTPRFNEETQKAQEFFNDLMQWSTSLRKFFVEAQNRLLYKNDGADLDLRLPAIDGQKVFVPVIPLFEKLEKTDSDENIEGNHSRFMLSDSDFKLFLEEQVRSLKESVKSLKYHFVSHDKSDEDKERQIISSMEAVAVLIVKHLYRIANFWSMSIMHIENMLIQQLNNAIGKRIEIPDLEEFVRFHNKRFFNENYAAEDFCYAIRRENHYPDGLLAIEEEGNKDGKNENAITFSRGLNQRSMLIPINSATSVKFSGKLYAHSWMLQRYSKSPLSFNIIARARQFSSFLLVLGKISGSNKFLPANAIVLQNKDEVIIPLILDEMPSAKEFKDAIGSLSPEQQSFARSFRNMKLSSSVFGVCVIQIKPQLEVLLGLSDESLTKEVELTQDLMSLFIEYQIPSDLLSYDGDKDVAPSEKVEKVKIYVNHVKAMIEKAKESDLEEARKTAQIKRYEAVDTCVKEDDLANLLPNPIHLQGSLQALSMSFAECGSSGQVCGLPTSARKPESRFQGSSLFRHRRDPQIRREESIPPSTETINQPKQPSSGEKEESQFLNLDNGHSEFSAIPKALDAAFETFTKNDKFGGSLRNVILKASKSWTKKYKPNLLVPTKTFQMNELCLKQERDKAFDLLDALSKSGALEICSGELHMLVASCHSFEKSLLNTVIQDNINPIEKIERSNLLAASVIHGVSYPELLKNDEDLNRLKLEGEVS